MVNASFNDFRKVHVNCSRGIAPKSQRRCDKSRNVRDRANLPGSNQTTRHFRQCARHALAELLGKCDDDALRNSISCLRRTTSSRPIHDLCARKGSEVLCRKPARARAVMSPNEIVQPQIKRKKLRVRLKFAGGGKGGARKGGSEARCPIEFTMNYWKVGCNRPQVDPRQDF